MSTETQKAQIRDHLSEGHGLTPLDALNKFGCSRLAARIHELREDGFPVSATMITTDSGARVARYSMGDA